ncbi:glutamine synthetase [Penicillium mononematosum]|uniref:glutamine synthetase n=1 Tax=Penicillium mononematosum TaxID=268346 RepID=UPI0025480E14|nr:glutamine synthetase [Penicillium mononematosum]KAJ6190523.1 glutamine synthetase [Penicillium mononematosum]
MPSHRQELEALLRMDHSIKYICVQWTDYSGVLRARFIPISRCLEIASGSETDMVSAPRLVVPAAMRLSGRACDRHELC